MGSRDDRSPEAQAYRRLYNTARWKRTRLAHLSAEPLCRMCRARGQTTPAQVCDHIDPRSKDTEAGFFAGPFQSLCKVHHDGAKQQQEASGFSREVGADGMPTDPSHPFNRA